MLSGTTTTTTELPSFEGLFGKNEKSVGSQAGQREGREQQGEGQEKRGEGQGYQSVPGDDRGENG